MKLALLLALAVCAPAFAADGDGLAVVKNAGQQRVLREKGFDKPPSLRAYGLTLDADGVYRAATVPAGSPPGTPRRTIGAEQLSTILARWQSANGTAVLAAPPADGPVAPRAQDAAAVVAHGERRAAVERTMNDGADSLTVPQRFDDAFGRPAWTPPVHQREPLRRGLLRVGYERLSTGEVPLESARPTSWDKLSSREIDDELFHLRGAGDDAVRAKKAELVRLLTTGTGEQRGHALRLLGGLRDESLLPVLLPALMREKDHTNRRAAAEALAGLAVSFKAKEGGWDAFLDKAPPILNVMMKSAPDWKYGSSTLASLYAVTDLLNLMEPADKKKFLGGFGDPRVMLMILSLGNTERIGRTAGVHSDTAALVYARYKELSDGAPALGAFMADPSVDAETRASLLDRLNRYKLIGPELKRDEAFRRGLPALLFAPGSKVLPNTVFSVAVAASTDPNAEFAHNSMAYLQSLPARDARAALSFFLLNPQMLDARQRADVNSRIDSLDPRMREELDEYRRKPSVYGYWPRTGPIEAALLMTQEGHARLFMKTLTDRGYKAERGSGGATRFTRGNVRLSLYQFASDKEGWAVDSDAVARGIAERLRDPKFQVVVYRGHVGDYGKSPLSSGDSARGKVFIDLSCDSDSQSGEVMSACEDCAFFGTNQTAEGAINNAFLPEALDGLASRESFADMNKRFQAKMPRLFHRFTGSWSAARLWERAAAR